MTMVRSATVEDAEVIGQIHVEGWQSSYDGLLPASYLSTIDVTERVRLWRQRLTSTEKATELILVAQRTHDSPVIGFLAASASRDPDALRGAAEIRAIYLRHAEKRTGVGTALMKVALLRLTEQGFDWVTLNVLEGNGPARAFYERFGFAPDGGRFIAEFGDRRLPVLRYAAPLPV